MLGLILEFECQLRRIGTNEIDEPEHLQVVPDYNGKTAVLSGKEDRYAAMEAAIMYFLNIEVATANKNIILEFECQLRRIGTNEIDEPEPEHLQVVPD